MKPPLLRAAVIGLGMGRNHVASFQSHPRCRVVAVADSDPARLRELGDQFKVPGRYTDPQAMLDAEDLDVVSIAVPNALHKPLALAAFRAGCHVLCEKPMALNAREGRAMLAAARKAGRRLMINFSFRFTPVSWALKREVDRGALGEVYHGRTFWHRRRGMPGFGGWFGQKALAGGGPLIDLGVHRLDLALWLMGYPRPAWVLGRTHDRIAAPLARASGKAFDVEDLASALITFTNGASLTVEASWAANIAENEWMETRLFGDRGGLVQRNVGGGYEFEAELYTDRRGALVRKVIAPARSRVPTSGWHFIDSLVRDTPHIATGEEGLRVMEILDAIYASARGGKPVRM